MILNAVTEANNLTTLAKIYGFSEEDVQLVKTKTTLENVRSCKSKMPNNILEAVATLSLEELAVLMSFAECPSCIIAFLDIYKSKVLKEYRESFKNEITNKENNHKKETSNLEARLDIEVSRNVKLKEELLKAKKKYDKTIRVLEHKVQALEKEVNNNSQEGK